MRNRFLTGFLAAGVALTFAACNVTKTEDGKAPDVDVDAGELPKYDVDAPEVTVTPDTQKVVTPDVDIKPATPDTTTAR
ncbi:MAG TPA: hypothetical protein VF035_04785 [Longimicrobiales bacterium]